MGNERNVVKQVPEFLLDFLSKKLFKGLPEGPTDQQGTINFLRDTPLHANNPSQKVHLYGQLNFGCLR
jgi:hypothetical protein